MGGEVLLFNRQINNKLSKNIFYFLSLFCFCRLPAARRVSSPDANQIPISNKRAALLLCAALLFFSIRINASAVLYCVSTTGGCILKFSLTISLSVHCKLFALI